MEYASGLRALPGCAADLIAIAVPADAHLPAKPGCGFPDTPASTPNPLSTLKDKAEQLLQRIVH